MRKRQSNERQLGRKTVDNTHQTHTAVKVGAGIAARMRLLVLMIMMTEVSDRRVLLVLTIRTHGRCSCLQRYDRHQKECHQDSHDAGV